MIIYLLKYDLSGISTKRKIILRNVSRILSLTPIPSLTNVTARRGDAQAGWKVNIGILAHAMRPATGRRRG